VPEKSFSGFFTIFTSKIFLAHISSKILKHNECPRINYTVCIFNMSPLFFACFKHFCYQKIALEILYKMVCKQQAEVLRCSLVMCHKKVKNLTKKKKFSRIINQIIYLYQSRICRIIALGFLYWSVAKTKFFSLFFAFSHDFSKSVSTGFFSFSDLRVRDIRRLIIFRTKVKHWGSLRCHLDKKSFSYKIHIRVIWSIFCWKKSRWYHLISLIFRWFYDNKWLISHFYQVDARMENEFCVRQIENIWICRKATWYLACVYFLT
jgi:hypothetical protein